MLTTGRAADRTSVPVAIPPRPSLTETWNVQSAPVARVPAMNVTWSRSARSKAPGQVLVHAKPSESWSGSLAATCNMTGELLATRPGELTMACTRGGALNTILILALPSSLARTQAADTGEVSSAGAVGGGWPSQPRAASRTEARRTWARRTWGMVRLLLLLGRARLGPRVRAPGQDPAATTRRSACG